MVTQKMEAQKIKIAVVVLNWNGKLLLEKFLPILVKHSKEATIFVADNGSSDNSIKFIEENFPNVNIISNPTNEGYAKGYNDSLKKINAEYYMLINSDIQVKKDWLKPLLELMENDLRIAACQPKILDYNNKNIFEYAGASGGFIDSLGYPFCRGRIFQILERDYGQYNDATEIFWATGACLLIKSDYYNEVNGLDEDFFAHQEEIDLCWRLKNKNLKIMVEPKSTVYHIGGGTLNASSPTKTYLNFRNNLFMLLKNLPIDQVFTIIPLRLILDGVAAITFINKEKGLEHIISIVKAHFHFFIALPKLISKRQLINQKRKLTGRTNWSIIIKNKVLGIRKFSDL